MADIVAWNPCHYILRVQVKTGCDTSTVVAKERVCVKPNLPTLEAVVHSTLPTLV